MILLFSLVTALIVPAQRQAPPPRDIVTEVRGRLDAYEERKQEDPQALAEIARLVMADSVKSNTFEVWSEACASRFASDAPACEKRLRAAAQRVTAPVAQRAKAAAILTRAGVKDGADLLLSVVKGLGARELAAVAPEITALAPERSVPLLGRALSSESDSDRAAACRALGTIDAPETRRLLADTAASIPPGTPAWLACTVARARLNEPDATWKLQGISSYMDGEALLDAADAMAAIGNNEGALHAVRKVGRQGQPAQQVSAALRLASLDAPAAAAFVDAHLQERDPALRARILEIERLLQRGPSAAVRRQLADANELVRLRGAEAVLAWAALRNK